jgi:hypothetical protein
MTQEALKLALDALENHTAIKHPQQIHYRDKAITAIKQALAQEQEPVAQPASEEDMKIYKTIAANYHKDLSTPPQRTEQEPVIGKWSLREVYFDEDGEPISHRSPPQRTWVGLTDEEIAQGWKESWVTEQAWQSAVWWAEDKLKQKNHVAQETN